MNGLGIVIEESTQIDESSSRSPRHSPPTSPGRVHRKYTNSSEQEEILLPPLPDENDLNEQSTTASVKEEESDSWNEKASARSHRSVSNSVSNSLTANLNSSVIANGINDASSLSESPLITDSTISLATDNDYFFQNSNSSFSTYELDSPSINHSNQLFPSVSGNNSNSSGVAKDNKDKEKDTSPLRRLKSLKRTIRKLSLSKSSSTSNIVSSSTTHNGTTSGNLFSSTNTGSFTGLGPALQQSVSNISPAVNSSCNSSAGTPTTRSDRPQLSPLQNHFKTVSLDSDGSVTTMDTKSKCITPTTPPYSSPIITLSDTANVKENLQKIEQNYFATFLKSQQSVDDEGAGELQDQTTLVNYYNYLLNEKNLIDESYSLTKNRLMKSGWCSTEDLNNLSLQKATQLNQIKNKLEEINVKLSKYD